MATRLMVLDKPSSSDLPTSSPIKKDNIQGEVRFQRVLARTEGKQHKESDASNHNKEEKRQGVKNEHSDSKPQANNLKSISKQAANPGLKNKINTEAAGSESFDSKNKEVTGDEDAQSLSVADDNIHVILEDTQVTDINVPVINLKLINGAQDEDIELSSLNDSQVKEIDDSAIIDPTAVNGAGGELLNSSKTDEKLEAVLSSMDESVVVGTTTTQVSSSLPTNLEGKNLLISETPLDKGAEVNILESEENNVEKKPVINEENIINLVATPINSKGVELPEAQDISISPAVITDESKLAKVQEAIVNAAPKMNSAETEIAREEDLSTSTLLAGNRELDKVNKAKVDSPEVQSEFNQNNLEELLLTDQETFDLGQSDDFSNNLLLKADNFVTLNDGKLSVSFKEIASLPEENIPHRADQVTMAVKSALNRGHSEISLHMYPEDLGVVDVKIEFSEVGKVQTIKFFVTNKDTLELLQRDYKALERSLSEVVKTDDASLSFNLRDGKGEGSDYQPQENFNLNSFGESSERITTSNYVVTHIQEDDQVNITV